MPDWTASMQQTFEYYIVDPVSWNDKELIKTVKSCTIKRDSTVETLGSATFDVTESIGECYIRAYLVTIQNGVEEKFPLGTYLVQTPSSSFTGSIKDISMDAYTPLLELKENPPPLGFYIPKGWGIMTAAYYRIIEHVRAPVVRTKDISKLQYDFIADVNDTWLSFVRDLLAGDNYALDLDERGRILFSPEQDTASLQPVWTYDDDNSSILYPDITMEHDLYDIPNAVEVIYSGGGEYYYAKVVNDDEDSPTSTVNRGREILRRFANPDIGGNPTKSQVERYARQLLRNLSSLEYTVTYTHGYCPVRVGDCVRLNYARAGLNGVKAKVISQSIKCVPGCPVTEKAVFTNKLWG